MMFITCGVCSGQNLVNNWSFEDTTACPNNLTQIDHAVGWMSFKFTPDYFNSCAPSTSLTPFSVPHNVWGDQDAHTGYAYAAFGAFVTGATNSREFVATQLNQSLIVGQKYFLSFWVSSCNGYLNPNNYPSMACNNIGARFSTIAFSQSNPQPVDNIAQVVDTNIINDTLNWVRISGSFIADSSYQYLSIGNHYDDSHTTAVTIGTVLPNQAFYYLDDVKLSTDSMFVNGINEQNNNTEVEVYPNPFNSILTFSIDNNIQCTLNLFDVASRKLLQEKFTNSISINTEQLAKGIYLYEVRNKNGVIKKGKIVKD